jgi:hypothetical protein
MKLMNHCTWKSVGRWILHTKKKKKKKKKTLLKLFNKGSTSCNCDMGHVIWNSFGWSGLWQCLNKPYPEIWLVGSINKNQKPSRSLQTNRHTNPLDPMYTLPSGPSLIPCGEKVRTPLHPSLLMLLMDNSVGIAYGRFFFFLKILLLKCRLLSVLMCLFLCFLASWGNADLHSEALNCDFQL